MKILTKEVLQENRACEEGLKDFARIFPGEMKTSWWTAANQLRLIKKSRLKKYIGWVFDRKLLPLWSMSMKDFSFTNLRDADLRGCDFRGCDFMCTEFRNANLRGCDLRNAYFYRADLRNCDLRGCDLTYCDLRGADLRGTNLRGANLIGATLTGQNVSDLRKRGAIIQ